MQRSRVCEGDPEDFEADRIEDFKGLAELSPWFGLIMLMLMFSLAGVPPFTRAYN